MNNTGNFFKWCLRPIAMLAFICLMVAIFLPKLVLSQTTIEINQSLSEESAKADKELDKYFKAIEDYLEDEPRTLKQLRISQKAWEAFRKSDCDAIYKHWEEGTIRTAMSHQHYIKLTRRRTHDLWSAYLTFMDSTPPILEEPKLK